MYSSGKANMKIMKHRPLGGDVSFTHITFAQFMLEYSHEHRSKEDIGAALPPFR